MRLPKFLVAGLAWGLTQSAIFLLLNLPESAISSNTAWTASTYISAGLWSSLIIAISVGFWLNDHAKALRAFLISQLVSFAISPFLMIDFLNPPEFLSDAYFLRLFSSYMLIFLFFVGLFGSMIGPFLSEWAYPPRIRALGWPFLSLGLCLDGIAVLFSIWRSSGNPSALYLGNLALPVVAGFTLGGFACFILGLRAQTTIRTERMGFLFLAGALLLGLSVISAQAASYLGFLYIELLAVAILLLSLGTIATAFFSQETEDTTAPRRAGTSIRCSSTRSANRTASSDTKVS